MHRKIHPLVGFAVLSAGVLSSSTLSSAAVLVKYEFTADATSLVPTTTGSGVTSANILSASGLSKQGSGVNFTGSSGPRVLGWQGSGTISGNLSEALTANHYFTFTLTPTAGQKMDLTNLTFFSNVGGTALVPRTLELQVSTDGTNFNSAGTQTLAFDDLSSTALFNMSLAAYSGVSTQTTFRIALYDLERDNVNWGSGNWVRFEDITVNGTVSPIPEPSAAFLGSIGALALFRRTRFRGK